MKRLSKIGIILGMSAVLSINTLAFNFKDVPTNHWAYTSASYMQQKGYMTVTSSGEFFPNAKVSYFEIAEILAKATGYQDELVIKDMDPVFKQSIKENYTHQLPYIKVYDDKYKNWVTRTNEEIAYLLGRGYLTTADLSKFMVKTSEGQEVIRVLTKEDLAVFLVRVLAKEETAKKEYKSTGFKDELKIKPENRPHVAYLAKTGLISGDKEGNFSPATEVTRGVCAKMTSDALKYKEKINTASNNLSKKGTIKNITPKNNVQKEYFINIAPENGESTWATLTQSTEIFNKDSKKITLQDIAVGDYATAFVEQKNGTEYISKLYITKASTSGNTGNTGGNTTDTGNTTTKPDTSLKSTSVKGTIDRIGKEDDLSILVENKVSTYPFSKYCTFISDGKVISKSDLKVDDSIKAYIEGNAIVRVEVLEQKETSAKEEAEFIRVVTKKDEYVLTVKQGSKEKEMIVTKDIVITKNGRNAQMQDLRVGDQLSFNLKNGEVVAISSETKKSSVNGRVDSILLGTSPKINIRTKDGVTPYAITPNTEIYDKDQRKNVTLEKVPIGALVEIEIESKEVIELTIEKASETFSYKGIIQDVEDGGEYITVLVDYDALTEEARVEKRIKIPVDVSILIDRKESYKSKLKEGMEVVIIFNYKDPLVPKSIEVISK